MLAAAIVLLFAATTALLPSSVVGNEASVVFAGRTVAFPNGNNGLTLRGLQYDLKACVCVFLQADQTTNYTEPSATTLNVTCPLIVHGGFVLGNFSQEKCFADTNLCDITQTFYFTGATDTGTFQGAVNTAQGQQRVLEACPSRVAAVGEGETLPREEEETAVLTGFILALALGYMGFTIVLLLGFCIAHRIAMKE